MDERNVDSLILPDTLLEFCKVTQEIKILMIKRWQKGLQEQTSCTVWSTTQSFQLEIQMEQGITQLTKMKTNKC